MQRTKLRGTRSSVRGDEPREDMRRLLIANRGEIARRIIRTAHRMGIETVAVFSDADAGAMHLSEATVAYALGGKTSLDSYLRIDKLIEAAHVSGADAVHPGYGFLSENADFAQTVIDAGLIWVGPPPSAIRTLGDKASAKQLARQQGVPCLPGYDGDDQSDARFATEAQIIGYPVMVKATAGGGGRGMRLAASAEQLPAALSSARSEALNSFGSAHLLLERALLRPRHVELQVFADSRGQCIHLGERDCSVQRRHQKIIEESPSPAVDSALRETMGQCAVNLALAAGYLGAGTVEFLLEEEPRASGGGGKFFYLMEMNTRLQVEHPVTELLTGLDLVEWQIRLARGEPLPLRQEQVRWQGHAIEVRLCAEDENFAPHSGQVLEFAQPSGIRFDHALRAGAEVPPYYDSMLGKIIAHGANRAEAIERLRLALGQTVLLGLPSNRAFLGACLDDEVFSSGQAAIPYLTEHADALRQRLISRERGALLPCALAVLMRGVDELKAGLPSPFVRPLSLRWRDQEFRLAVQELGGGRFRIEDQDGLHDLSIEADAHKCRWVNLRGVRQPVLAQPVGAGRWHVQCGEVDLWLEDISLEAVHRAGQVSAMDELRAPFNGRLIALPAQAGQRLRRGELLAVIESMKLEHALCAPRDLKVKSVAVQLQQQLASRQLLMSFEPA